MIGSEIIGVADKINILNDRVNDFVKKTGEKGGTIISTALASTVREDKELGKWIDYHTLIVYSLPDAQ